jgi:prepilin-type N-terminal cleavage/methylation domain-containing protein
VTGPRQRLADESGFTLIEVLAGMLMLAFVVAAGSVLFTHGNDSSITAQRESQLISVADQQIEAIRESVKTQGFSALAMNAVPAAGTNSTLSFDTATHTDPNDLVSASTGCGPSNAGYAIEANYDDTSEGPASGVTPWSGCTNTTSMVAEPLEVLSGGFVTPETTNVTVGTDTATVYRYVTDAYVGCSTTVGGCPTTTSGSVSSCTWPSSIASTTACSDARRVIVAVVLNNHGRYTIGQASPVYLSTIFTNPVPSNAPNSSVGITLGLQLG